MTRAHLTACLLLLGSASPALSQEALEPGGSIRLEFEELPPTYHAMHVPDAGPATVLVRLPDDYTPDRDFPLFVFLEGGWGGNGFNLSTPLQVSRGEGCIAANFPLFRKAIENPDDASSIGIGFDDYAVVSEAYRVILDRIRETIPNIDAATSVIGGHSNGAKTIAVLLSALDENMLDSFGGFFLVDGGFEWTSFGRTSTLGDHHILYLVGGGEADPPWWREHCVERVRYFEEVARRYDVEKWEFVVTEGVGHEFAPSYRPIIREWLSGVHR